MFKYALRKGFYLCIYTTSYLPFHRCPHCKSFAPEYEQAASKAQAEKLNAFFAKVRIFGLFFLII